MSILPFPSFLDDVKEKGLKRALLEGIDQTVERLTAGMNIQDIREALRGENPSRRPNPRLQPHADGFWLHMRPSYFHQEITGIYPTFRLGWLSTYFVVFETITGVLLTGWYTPSPEIAYANMLNILSNIPFGQFVRDLHRLGAEFMVAIVALHMMRTWITGSYKKPRQFTWFTGVLLLIITGFLSFTGYLLPWDQLALWAVTIGASMAEATPVIGEQVNLILRGAPEMGANGLLRFYLAHVLFLPILLFIFTGVHYYKVIIHGHSLPPQVENIGEDTAKRVPLDKRVYFIPDVLTNEMMWIAVTTFVMVVLVIFFYQAPLENHADPQVTPLGTTAPWYFLWIQGALKLGDKVFWGIIFPTLALGGLAILPYLDVTISRRYAHRRFMLTLAMLLVSVTTVLSYMGLPEFAVQTSAEIEILHQLNAEPAHNHVGPMRAVPFNELRVGAYTTRELHAEPGSEREVVAAFNQEILLNGQFDQLNNFLATQANLATRPGGMNPFTTVPADAPHLREVLHKMDEMIAKNPNELPNAWGAIIITQAQDGLMRVDTVISWDGVVIEDGEVLMMEDGSGPVMDVQTIEVPMMNADGTPMLNADGTPMVETQEVVARRISGEHIFIHKDSAYFE